MSNPTPPAGSGKPPPNPPPGSGEPAPGAQKGQYESGIAMWQKFLSVGGNQATPEQAKAFLNQLLKTMNTYIQQCSDRMVDAIKKLRDEDDDDS
jgi:hypothetical protein